MTHKLKVCMVGATGVGKTSLVRRFAHSIFSANYRTTIGVAIERRDLQRGDDLVQLVIWDLNGEDEFQNVQPAYLKMAAGYLLVIDGSRPDTIDTAIRLEARVRAAIGAAPFVVAINKVDLTVLGDSGKHQLERLAREGWPLVRTSAKTGAGVEEVFERLVDAVLRRRP
jgi:small GTP-binding protein